MGLIVSDLAAAPLELFEAREHLRVLHHDDDDAISALIAAGFDEVERLTGRLFRYAICELTLRGFPAGDEPIALPRSPVRTVESVAYLDGAGDAQTLDDTIADLKSIPATIEPAVNATWPSTQNRPGAVTITFTAGATAVPAVAKHAVLLFLDLEYHEHTPAAAERLRRRMSQLVAGLRIRNAGLSGIGD